jgi:alpha-mannosidase
LHDADSALTRDLIERTADDVLLPLTGASVRSALTAPAPRSGVELEGTGLACSTITLSEDRASLVLRCVNLSDEPQNGAWTVGDAVSDARLARLDETPLSPLPISGNRIAFTAPSRGVVTILVR